MHNRQNWDATAGRRNFRCISGDALAKSGSLSLDDSKSWPDASRLELYEIRGLPFINVRLAVAAGRIAGA